MRATLGLLLATFLIGILPGTSSADVSLGTNLGLMVFDPSGGGGSTTIFEMPNTVGDLQPGLRLGFRPSDPHHELYLNTGLIYTSRSGHNSHFLEATVNYQYNLTPQEATSAYLTAGGGLLTVGGSNETASTSGIFGGGLGVRFRVAEGHGSLRAEARLDRFGESDSIHEGTMFGLRLGFDLWLQ